MAFDLGAMTDLIGITVAAGVVMKVSDAMLGPQSKTVRRIRKSTRKNKSKEPLAHQRMYKAVWGR
jgi:demethoxyubiquinone hydroxylase (CLK1/Coq7/Cat5 family)